MKPTEKQQLAIDTRDKTLLVSAAAGSGKTATLTRRIIESLTDSNSPASISDMLIVTFTRPSAADLREKISKALSDALIESPGDERLTNQLIALGSAHISTIDSFYYEIVKNNFQRLSIGLTQAPRIADEAEIAPLNIAIMEETIDSFFLTSGFERFTEHFSNARTSGQIGEIFLNIYKKLLPLRYGVNTLKALENELLDAADEDFLNTAYGKTTQAEAEAFLGYAINLTSEMLNVLSTDEAGFAAYGAAFSDDLTLWQRIRGYIISNNYEDASNAISNSKFTGLKSYKGNNPIVTEQKDKRNKLKTAYNTFVKNYFSYTPDAISRSFKENAEICHTLHALLAEFERRLMEEKKLRGAFEFNDIRRFVLELLYNSDDTLSDIALEYKSKFKYIYIDEYQDVDDVQDAIFTALARENNRFMVGDIKQSIYGFRGANPNIFATYKRKLPILGTAVGEQFSLFMSENFRCDESVIDFTNTVSSYLFKIRAQSIEYSHNDDLKFAKKYDDPRHKPVPAVIAITGILPDGVENSSLTDIQKAENACASARYVAREIKRLVESEKLAPKKNENGELVERKIEYGDIAIMARSTTNFAALEKELTALGIPVDFAEKKSFFDNPEVLLVLSLLNTIDNPQKDIPLAGALRSPFYGFSLDDIIKLRTHASSSSLSLYDALVEFSSGDDELAKKCRSFNESLKYWRAAAEASPCDKLIQKLYKEFSLLSYSEKNTKNLQALYEYAIRYESSGFKGLYGFIKYVDELINSKVTVSLSSNITSSNCVQLMSIHHSKGLEFPVCFVYNCEKPFNDKYKKDTILFNPSLGIGFTPHDETGLAQYQSPLRHTITSTESVLQREEEMRLLYVAMTRAMERLYLVANLPNEKKKLGSVMEISKYDKNYAVLKSQSYIEWVMMSLEESEKPDSFVVHRIPSDVVLSASEDESEETAAPQVLTANTVANDEEKYDRELAELLEERFSFKYSYDHISKLPAKLTVSKLSPSVLDLYDNDDTKPEMLTGDFEKQFADSFIAADTLITEREVTAAERGTATHAFLQFCDFDRVLKGGIEEECNRLAKEKFIPTHYSEIINKKQLSVFFEGKLFERILKARKLWREQRFNIFLPASEFTSTPEKSELLENEKIAVQGVIDLFFEDADGKIILCDYKTDYLNKEEINDKTAVTKKLTETHGEQLSYYAKAIEAMLGKAPDEVLIYSLPFGDTVDIDVI